MPIFPKGAHAAHQMTRCCIQKLLIPSHEGHYPSRPPWGASYRPDPWPVVPSPRRMPSRDKWQLLAVSCLQVAAKYEEAEENVPAVSQLARASGIPLTVQTVQKWEVAALENLGEHATRSNTTPGNWGGGGYGIVLRYTRDSSCIKSPSSPCFRQSEHWHGYGQD
jgi:hypothetical protein